MDSGKNSIENDVPGGPARDSGIDLTRPEALGAVTRKKGSSRNAAEAGQDRQGQLVDAQIEVDGSIPSTIQKRFHTATTDQKSRFYFRDDKNRLAFEDHGPRMSTEHNDPMVAQSMVELAVAKGWANMNISGHEDFKREIWLQASMRGIEVSGYKPKDIDFARLKEMQKGADKVPSELRRDFKIVAAVMADVLKQKGYSLKSIEKTMEEAAKRLGIQQDQGKPAPGLKMYDRSAPRQRDLVAPKFKAREKDKERTVGGR